MAGSNNSAAVKAADSGERGKALPLIELTMALCKLERQELKNPEINPIGSPRLICEYYDLID
jgi:hypothetical protein